ncbi:MAG: peptide ABC transporter substrate-binding protein [Lachnospiraceae bacterium]|nr:peptide ABC transporter substrate-binding protein [Lachnospiraceae bacterium]
MKYLRSFSLICLVLSLVMGGCSGELPDIDNRTLSAAYNDDAKVYRNIYSAEVQNLNYLITCSSVDTVICANVIEALVDYDDNGNIVPGLAESWEANEDMTEWTFHLRDDITWVDYEGEYYADVVADDWVCAAEFVNDASNEAECQYMYSTGSVVKNAAEYYDYTSYLINPSAYNEPPEQFRPQDIGVKAVSDKTLVYLLEKPCPFFPSVLSYTTYLPICRKYLEKSGSMFARDYKNMLYNGAYVLHYFEPLEKRILVKNPTYWDRDNVFIDRVESYYDPDAVLVGAKRYMSGNIDSAVIPPDRLSEYMSDPEYAKEIHKSLPDSSFSYFYAFNYMPLFDEKYEPENWEKAVSNLNFRKAVASAIDRVGALSVYEPNNPEMLVNNTVTPEGAAVTGGKDFTEFGRLKEISSRDSYDRAMAVSYRDKAIPELKKKGVTFPIKVLMPYNPANAGWKEEAFLVKDQLEGTLGNDFIEVYVEEGSDTGFLLSVRMSGKYALMKCRWGADYADPQTWTEPFEEDGDYTFWHRHADMASLNDQWEKLIKKASSITDDDDARYTAFSEAEALIIDNAVVIPFSIMNGEGYIMDRLDPFEGEYSTYGMAPQRYKLHHLMEDSMDLDEFNRKYEEWINR